MQVLRFLAANIVVAFGIASTLGSGGGGGGISDDFLCCFTNPDLPDLEFDYVEITTMNAQAVAARVVRAAAEVSEVSVVIGGQIFPAQPSFPGLLSSNTKFDTIMSVSMSGAATTEACLVAGTVFVVDAIGNNPAGFSEGDYFSLYFDACDDGDGYRIDGEISFRIAEIVGDPLTDLVRLRYAGSSDITISAGSESLIVTGGGNLVWDSLNFPASSLAADPFSSLRIVQNSSENIFRRGSQALTLDAGVTPLAQQFESERIRLEKDNLADIVYYETQIPVQGIQGQDPDSGQILVSEAIDDGTIQLVIESSAIVRLEIDEDGDGILEDIQFTTWAALSGNE